MPAPRVLVVLGHPRTDSLCGAIAAEYARGARAAGAEVELLALGETVFDVASRDPATLRWQGPDQDLERDVHAAVASLRRADHVVLVFPQWWGTYPALLKGFVDRVFLAQLAFRHRGAGLGWDRLLTGRTARVVMTMDSPVWWDRLRYRSAAVHSLVHATLGFCGIRTVGVTRFARVRTSSEATRRRWLATAAALGRSDARRRVRTGARGRARASGTGDRATARR
ncbi:flavodoxin family protein [Cellulomonas sp. JZ18]|uniref:NAD(P)H-dependent oxidoreductase n=1 Tax=Cellulomonas sp. JZ18 TaxID=2654191 RepID=UPI0012D436AA|nr:NAD(P)H-dependent oxidoreductase [Cellulomonas sp. JZ18]QGQ20025.1 flavodoxin family protein [Cellulomonas sp. JZ18]